MPRRTEKGDGFWNGLDGLDKLLEHRTRLGICVILSRNDTVNFQRLKALLEETDGSLGAHLRKLEESDYIAVKKEFHNRKPVSWYKLTRQGRSALKSHLKAMEQLIRHNAPKSAR